MSIREEQHKNLARMVAYLAHRGQTDKAGEDYFKGHLTRVASTFAHQPLLQAVAWLHDVVEDTEVTPADLRDVGLPIGVVEAVCILTHQGGETYAGYIDRVVRAYRNGRPGGSSAYYVKMADVNDHLRNPEVLNASQLKRYHRAMDKLNAARLVE